MIIEKGLINRDIYAEMEEKTLKLFEFASKLCSSNNLILVDCKFEFGINPDNELVVIDEIFTPDASRFWIQDTYANNFSNEQKPDILDKEFFRQWLINEKNYMGDGVIPDIPDNIKVDIEGCDNNYINSNQNLISICVENILQNSVDVFQKRRRRDEQVRVCLHARGESRVSTSEAARRRRAHAVR